MQMDNAKSNKCWAVIGELIALVCLGVCVKVKLSFCLPAHAHIRLCEEAISNKYLSAVKEVICVFLSLFYLIICLMFV